MKNILVWTKPEKIMSTEKWKEISACGCPPGVYTPNMSEEDMFKWKAKLVGVKSTPKVEIRKTFQKQNGKQYPNNKNIYAQCLIVISNENIDGMKDCRMVVSLNGKAGFSEQEMNELNLAIAEAKAVLNNL